MSRVFVEMPLQIKHVRTKSEQINRLGNMVNALVTQRHIDPLLCLKVELPVIVIDPGETRPSWYGSLFRAPLPNLRLH